MMAKVQNVVSTSLYTLMDRMSTGDEEKFVLRLSMGHCSMHFPCG